jgi:hypothetical protein
VRANAGRGVVGLSYSSKLSPAASFRGKVSRNALDPVEANRRTGEQSMSMRWSRSTLTRVLQESQIVTAEWQCRVDAPPAHVWAAIEAPEYAMRAYEDVVDAGHLPNSPRGLGEMQYTVRRDETGRRRVSVLEVVEYEPGRRAVIRNISSDFRSEEEIVLAEDEQGCLVRHRSWAEIPAGFPIATAKHLKRAMDQSAFEAKERTAQVFGHVTRD